MPRPLILILSILALLLAQWWMSGRQDGAVFQGELFDSDSAMRLVRVQKLIAGYAWYDNRIARANTPHGHDLHWSRPLDTLLWAGAALLAPFLGWQDGLHQAGVWISPLLHLLTLLALLWAARPLLPPAGLLWLGLLFPLQLFLDHQFAPGRPDHHALILFLFVCALGALIRAMETKGTIWAAATGLALGLMLWVSVEGLLMIALACTLFGLRWWIQGRAWALHGLVLGAVTTSVCAIAILLEYPIEQITSPVYDKISIAYVFLLLLIMNAFAVAALAPTRWPGLLAFALAPLAEFWAFPEFFQGPLAGQDPVFTAAIFKYAGETKGLRSLSEVTLYLGPVLIALPYGLWRLCVAKTRWPWLVITAGLVLYLPLSMMQIRWAPYAVLLALPGYSAVLIFCINALKYRRNTVFIFLNSLARTSLVLSFAFAPLLLSAQLPRVAETARKCRTDTIARYLAAHFKNPQRILSYMTVAPAILYRSAHEVVATPYFRNAQGGRDTLAFFRAEDPITAQATQMTIVKSRRIDLVLTCPADREGRIYGAGFNPPAWLQPLRLPRALTEWRLYRVRL